MFLHKVDEEISLKVVDFNDADALYTITDNSRDYLREWFNWVDITNSVDDTKEFIKFSLKGYADRKNITTLILYKGNIAGTIDFHALDWTNKIGSIGYWLDKDYQGFGIMTRATRAFTDYAFKELKLNRVEIRAAFENKKSRAIPERLGFMEEGIIRHAQWIYDHYVDHVVYGMLADDWNS